MWYLHNFLLLKCLFHKQIREKRFCEEKNHQLHRMSREKWFFNLCKDSFLIGEKTVFSWWWHHKSLLKQLLVNLKTIFFSFSLNSEAFLKKMCLKVSPPQNKLTEQNWVITLTLAYVAQPLRNEMHKGKRVVMVETLTNFSVAPDVKLH